MIKPTKSYKDSTGKIHATVEEAQAAEIVVLLKSVGGLSEDSAAIAAVGLVDAREKVIDILTTSEKSRPTARKINGGTRTRKPKAQQPELVPVTPTEA